MDSKELGPAETLSRASKQEASAVARAAEQALEARPASVSDSAEPDGLSDPKAPAESSEATASSNSFSLSPQPSLQLHTSMPPEQQQSLDPPSRLAPAAQAPAPAAQEEGALAAG